jgi:mxaA protein
MKVSMKTNLLPKFIGIALVCCLTTGLQAAEVKIIQLSNPPASNGIRIGDILNRSLELEVPQGYQLPATALPMQGDTREGMELRAIHVTSAKHGGQQRYSIALSYQVFAHANVPVVMQLPAEHLVFTGGAQPLSVDIPAWHFWYSPLVAASVKSAKQQLQPQYKASLLDLDTHQMRLKIWLALLVLAVLGLIYINADKRWLPFMNGAFAQAHRRIKQASRHKAAERQALIYLHQAFNQTYGANLFAYELDDFLARQPKFAKLKQEIQDFFEQSNAVLFANQPQNQAQFIKQLTKLSKRLRDCERGV